MVKLSVLIMCYNFQDYVETCLLSSLSQKTNFNYEIIICDDNSTDNSLVRIKNIANINSNIQVIKNDKNIGAQKSYKKLLDSAKGEYIIFLDGDDYWTCTDTFQKQVDFLDENPDYQMCFTGYREISLDGDIKPDNNLNYWYNHGGIPENDNEYSKFLIYRNIVHFSKMYKNDKKIFKDYMLDLEILDWPLNFEISLLGKIKYLNYPSGVHRLHKNNMMSTIRNSTKDSQINEKIIKILLNRFEESKFNL